MKTQIFSTEMLYAAQRKKASVQSYFSFIFPSLMPFHPGNSSWMPSWTIYFSLPKDIKKKKNQGGNCYLRNSSSLQNYWYTFRKSFYSEGKERTMTDVCGKKHKTKAQDGWNKSCWCLHIILIFIFFLSNENNGPKRSREASMKFVLLVSFLSFF